MVSIELGFVDRENHNIRALGCAGPLAAVVSQVLSAIAIDRIVDLTTPLDSDPTTTLLVWAGKGGRVDLSRWLHKIRFEFDWRGPMLFWVPVSAARTLESSSFFALQDPSYPSHVCVHLHPLSLNRMLEAIRAGWHFEPDAWRLFKEGFQPVISALRSLRRKYRALDDRGAESEENVARLVEIGSLLGEASFAKNDLVHLLDHDRTARELHALLQDQPDAGSPQLRLIRDKVDLLMETLPDLGVGDDQED